MKLRFLFAALFFFLVSLSARAQCTSFTPNVGFGLPVIGATSAWGTCINTNFSMLDTLLGGHSTFSPNAATPSVAGYKNWVTANTIATIITNFTGGYPGQQINVFCNDVNTTMASGAHLGLSGPFSCSMSVSISLVLQGAVWTEIGRGGGSLFTGGVVTNSTLFEGGLPSYDAAAFPGAICNGNTNNVTVDSAAILAAINAANAASPAGGIINIDNCVWLPPNPLPTPNAGIILQARTGFIVTATLYLQQGYYLQGQPNAGSPVPQFGVYPGAEITPSPNTISPVIEVVTNATAGTTIQNIEIGSNFTGVGIESLASQTVLRNVIVTSTSNTAQPVWFIGGFGDRIIGGVFNPGSGSTNPSIRLSNNSATNNEIRDVRISGAEAELTLNYQGILLDTTNGSTPIASDCAAGIIVDSILYENATAIGNKHLFNVDSSLDCVRSVEIRYPYVADTNNVAIFNSGSGAEAVEDITIWEPIGGPSPSAPLFAGMNLVGGVVHTSSTANAANQGANIFSGLIVDQYGLVYVGGACQQNPCSIMGGLAGDVDTSATTNVYKRASAPTVANMSFNQRAGESGDLFDCKNSSVTIICRADYLGNISGTSLSTTTTVVGSLPSASVNVGKMIVVTDSTAIGAEGQSCVGGNSTPPNTAIAFSNGASWKCF
jgi:hypothetical protein